MTVANSFHSIIPSRVLEIKLKSNLWLHHFYIKLESSCYYWPNYSLGNDDDCVSGSFGGAHCLQEKRLSKLHSTITNRQIEVIRGKGKKDERMSTFASRNIQKQIIPKNCWRKSTSYSSQCGVCCDRRFVEQEATNIYLQKR